MLPQLHDLGKPLARYVVEAVVGIEAGTPVPDLSEVLVDEVEGGLTLGSHVLRAGLLVVAHDDRPAAQGEDGDLEEAYLARLVDDHHVEGRLGGGPEAGEDPMDRHYPYRDGVLGVVHGCTQLVFPTGGVAAGALAKLGVGGGEPTESHTTAVVDAIGEGSPGTGSNEFPRDTALVLGELLESRLELAGLAPFAEPGQPGVGLSPSPCVGELIGLHPLRAGDHVICEAGRRGSQLLEQQLAPLGGGAQRP